VWAASLPHPCRYEPGPDLLVLAAAAGQRIPPLVSVVIADERERLSGHLARKPSEPCDADSPTPPRALMPSTLGDRAWRSPGLLAGVTEPVLQRAFWYLRNVDKNVGERVEKGARDGQA
jgi:hypothetical protein